MGIWPKIKAYVAVAVSTAAFLLWGYWRARSDGEAAARNRNSAARDKLQEHYDAIDRSNIDPDSSYSRLRGMSDKGRR